MGKRKYTDVQLGEAVRESYTMGQVATKLGVNGGGSRKILKERVLVLGLDTKHFTRKGIGRPRTRFSYTCQECGTLVPLQGKKAPRVYCSDACLSSGRPKTIRSVLASEEIRGVISQKAQASWDSPEGRAVRMSSMNKPEVRARRLVAIRKASQDPKLRAKRSQNAKKQWRENHEWRESFIAASTKARRERALVSTSPWKPHIPCTSKKHGAFHVRSLWERDFVYWLDLQDLDWDYEPTRVVVARRPYTPDFLVHFQEGPAYVELHRVQNPVPGDTKIVKMRAAQDVLVYPLILVGEEGIKKMRGQLKGFEEGWELITHPF